MQWDNSEGVPQEDGGVMGMKKRIYSLEPMRYNKCITKKTTTMNECLCKYTNKVSFNEIYLVKDCKKACYFLKQHAQPKFNSKNIEL